MHEVLGLSVEGARVRLRLASFQGSVDGAGSVHVLGLLMWCFVRINALVLLALLSSPKEDCYRALYFFTHLRFDVSAIILGHSGVMLRVYSRSQKVGTWV